MQQDLQSALLVFLILATGVVSAGIIYLRSWLQSNDVKNTTLRALFCLEFEEEVKIQIAKSPMEFEGEVKRKKTILGRLEDIAGELTSPFKSSNSPNVGSPDLESALEYWARSPNYNPNKTINLGHIQRKRTVHIGPTFLIPDTPTSPEGASGRRRFST